MNQELPKITDRRQLLRLSLAASLGLAGGIMQGCSLSATGFQQELRGANPFVLGVASGHPTANSVVLWTRLAVAGPGRKLPNAAIAVQWEVAEDEQFRKIVAQGTANALPELGHSIHVEPRQLQAQRHYWYRFRLGDAVSPVGHTLTAPDDAVMAERLRMVLASCQHWEQGYFHAWKHAVADQPDVILFVGDYIYEYGAPSAANAAGRPRLHNSPEVITLQAYRDRYALYKSDPHLQAAHAAAPWIVTWDDHEVANDYANDEDERRRPNFLARRAAAYQAFWENMPVPLKMLELSQLPSMQIYARHHWGQLARFHVLDDRQYRDHQACQTAERAGSRTVWRDQCAELDDPKRSLLGSQQESWLDQGLHADNSAWTILGQQTLMAHSNQALDADLKNGRERYWTDGWNGYQPARERLLQSLQAAQARGHARDTLVMGGDVHAWYLCDLQTRKDVAAQGTSAKIVASEVCGTSITSRSWPQETTEKIAANLPHYRYARSDTRGYTLIDLDRKRAGITLRGVKDVLDPNSAVQTVASMVVERGRPGIQKA